MNGLKLMTWNIGGAYNHKMPLLNKLRNFLNNGIVPKHVVHKISEAIKSAQPEIVCLQEVRRKTKEGIDHLKEINANLQKKYKTILGGETHGEHRALLVSKKQKVGKIEEIKTKNKKAAGIAAYIPKKKTWFASIHLDYSDDLLRFKQLQAIIDWAKNKKAVIAGDFNFKNSWHFGKKNKELTRKMVTLLKKNKFKELSKAINWTHIVPFTKFDYVWTNRQIKSKFSVLPKRWHMMDHYPLFGKLFLIKKRN